jgi:hypothetical protein
MGAGDAVLAAKLALVPLLIAGITIAGARLGPRIAGVLTGLPVVAGPIVLFLALEQGPDFAARSARATLAGEASLGVFCVLYAYACLRAPWWATVAIGWLGFAVATAAFDRLDPSLPAAVALALATPIVLGAVMPRPPLPTHTAATSRVDLAVRMGAGVVLVLALTAVAAHLGPRLSGLLTVFPVATTVLAVFSHRMQGAAFAVHLLCGLAAGLYCLTAFFLTLALALEPLGVAPAFAAAVVASLVVQAAVLALH